MIHKSVGRGDGWARLGGCGMFFDRDVRHESLDATDGTEFFFLPSPPANRTPN